jgi:two-component system, sensor histidine kinase and response regulator
MPLPQRALRVLVAEDTPANQRAAVHVLSKRGHDVVVAETGAEALAQVKAQEFDVVLMDVQMPVMDGLQATAAIRDLADPCKAKLPIIAMTAHTLKEDRELCLAGGMDGYISKPLDRDELVEMVERLADGAAFRVGKAVSGPAAVGAHHSRVFDLGEALSRCDEDYDLLRDVVSCLFDEADLRLEQMQVALERLDAESIHATAHRLKGTLLYLAAAPATKELQRLEEMGRSGDLAGAAQVIETFGREVQRLKEVLAVHRRPPAP